MADDAQRFVEFCATDFGREIIDREAEYLRRELEGHRRILEVGCGIGALEERLPQFNITGLDINPEMLAEARKRSAHAFVLGNAERLEFPDASFDAVFFVTSLEFTDDYRKAAREAARVLEPGGKLLLMMLNPESEYFAEHWNREGSYFRRIKHSNLGEIKEYVSRYFSVADEYFLGIRGNSVFDTTDPGLASLYVLKGTRL